MKKIFTLSISFLLSMAMLWAQSPQKMSYQAVIRTITNELVISKTVGLRISILKSTESGTLVYSEMFENRKLRPEKFNISNL